MTRPFLLGLTGNIACGKSTVAGMLVQHGATAIDADRVYHDLIVPGAPLWHEIRRRFGDGVVAGDGTIDRPSLARTVFGDAAALSDLDRLTHAPILAELRRRVAATEAQLVVVDAVKLFESGYAAECDAVWVVTCREDREVERLMARSNLTRHAAERRVAAQPPLGVKIEHADAVIGNDGTLDETRAQVERALERLRRDRQFDSTSEPESNGARYRPGPAKDN